MVPDERYKSAAFQHFCGVSITVLFDELQFLMLRIPHGNNHPPTFGKLSEERFRNCRRGSSDENRIKRRKFWQSQRAVAAMHVRVCVSNPCKPGGRAGSQSRPPLDREDILGQTSQHSSLITTARANFQYPVARLQMQRRSHGRHDVRLRNGLATADRQRRIFIRARTNFLRHEFVPRHYSHRAKYGAIRDAATAYLFFDHFSALHGVIFLFRHG